jgi:tetratricopeptide (TPR) repeat protein
VPPADVWPPLGKVLLLQGQYQRLLDELPADDQQADWLALRGHALFGLHHDEEARAVFMRIAAQHAGTVAALLGQARLALQDDRKEDALALVRKAVAQQVRLLGDVLRLLDNNAEALTVYQRILKLHPAQVQAHVDLASLYIQSGKLRHAKNCRSRVRPPQTVSC